MLPEVHPEQELALDVEARVEASAVANIATTRIKT